MANIKISDLHPSILSEDRCFQLAENPAVMIELSTMQMESIAGGFWFCRFTPRLFVYPSPKSKADLVA